MKHGIYLCYVKGQKYCDYAVLKYDEYGWWQYVRYYGLGDGKTEGWFACALEVVEVMQQLEEDKYE